MLMKKGEGTYYVGHFTHSGRTFLLIGDRCSIKTLIPFPGATLLALILLIVVAAMKREREKDKGGGGTQVGGLAEVYDKFFSGIVRFIRWLRWLISIVKIMDVLFGG